MCLLGQPCLSSKGGFQQPGGRICGLFISSGLVLNIYFPSRSCGQTITDCRNYFISFIDELINFTEEKIRSGAVSWLACGTDTNAHFKWANYPPRKTDDFAARQVRKFMRKFGLISLSEKICPDRFTFLNSRGGSSSLDSFLVSVWLWESGCVVLYEVLDFLEHGSDHSPVYVKLKVFPKWIKKPKVTRRRIINYRGMESLRKRLKDPETRLPIVNKIIDAFSDLNWKAADSLADINALWTKWKVCYNGLVQSLIGTRLTREFTCGRKFDDCLRKLCKRSS